MTLKQFFCFHSETTPIKFYSYDSPWLSVYRQEVCKRCGQVVHSRKISEYYALWNLDILAKRLEAKGVKNIEDG